MLFIVEAVKKFFNPDISMMYMSDHGVPEILFYPSIAFELIVPLLLIAGYKIKIVASSLTLFVQTVTIIFMAITFLKSWITTHNHSKKYFNYGWFINNHCKQASNLQF